MPAQPSSWQTAKKAGLPLKTVNNTASLSFRIRFPIHLLFYLLNMQDPSSPPLLSK